MVQAARKYNRICQVGTQSRSTAGMREAIDYVHAGKIGAVSIAYGTCYKPRGSISDAGLKHGDQAPPKTMDYDLWTGPAALQMPRRNTSRGTVHYDWHWIWNYGNGDIGNQGVHEMDKARWGLNVGLPLSVVSVGGRVGYLDDGETPTRSSASSSIRTPTSSSKSAASRPTDTWVPAVSAISGSATKGTSPPIPNPRTEAPSLTISTARS